MVEMPGSELVLPADLVLLAMGFVCPAPALLEGFRVDPRCARQRQGGHRGCRRLLTNVAKVFAAGDMRRGQSLVVWAIREGRQAARAIDEFLMGDR